MLSQQSALRTHYFSRISNNNRWVTCHIQSLFNMKLRGSLLVIVCCMVIEFCHMDKTEYLLFRLRLSDRLINLSAIGLLFLFYPVVGHLTDVYLTRYHSLKWSFVMLILSTCLLVICGGIHLALARTIEHMSFFHHNILANALSTVVLVCFYAIGLGLFQANAIQFGLDQLLEAPTPKLIAFIHWYYWGQNVGSLAFFFITAGRMYIVDDVNAVTNDKLRNEHIVILEDILVYISFAIVFTTVLITLCTTKKHLYVQKAGLNPFKNIYRVLKYSWKHKVPEHRSAFTYWEEDIPRRIDLGKNKYGGPFTNEEVEDTKTFFRIFPLLLCLFGYHLAGEGYSAPDQLQRTSCPSLPVLLFITHNPLHLSTLVSVVGIPLYRLVITKVFPRVKNVRMLTKMWIGLFLSLLQVVLYIIVVVNHDTTYWQQHHSVVYNETRMSESVQCYVIRSHCAFIVGKNKFICHQYNDPVDNTYLWFIIPQLLNGLSSLLVSMTVFEFICAQAPRTTQGLLIGLWYATFSIRYLVVAILDNLIIERRSWLIYEGVKGFLILVSLVLFSCVSGRYRYRQRDEIVNVQAMIEDTHERWLDQEEEYMEEQRSFYQATRLYSAV